MGIPRSLTLYRKTFFFRDWKAENNLTFFGKQTKGRKT
jgi:hypothetical protein